MRAWSIKGRDYSKQVLVFNEDGTGSWLGDHPPAKPPVKIQCHTIKKDGVLRIEFNWWVEGWCDTNGHGWAELENGALCGCLVWEQVGFENPFRAVRTSLRIPSINGADRVEFS